MLISVIKVPSVVLVVEGIFSVYTRVLRGVCLPSKYKWQVGYCIVSFAAVFWDVVQRSQRALRDIPKNGCEGD